MTLPTLTTTKISAIAVSKAGANLTNAEWMTRIETLLASSVHWEVSQKVIDAVNNRSYMEIKPKSTDPLVKDIRMLLCWSAATTAQQPAAANKSAPSAADVSSRMWMGISPNAGTTGPNADPYVGLAYTSAAWGKMLPMTALPVDGSFVGALESAEHLILDWTTNSAAQKGIVGVGRLFEYPDGNSAECVGIWTPSWQGEMASSSAVFPLPHYNQNGGTGSAGVPKAMIVKADGSILQVNRGFPDSCSNAYTFSNTDYAILISILAEIQSWAVGTQGTLGGFWRQMRWGPKAADRYRLIDAASLTNAICWSYHGTSAQASCIWFDNQR